MSAIVRKTYDTDSIVLRRIFAVNPETNARVSTNSVLVTGVNGSALFQDGSVYLSTIGAPTSDSLVSTVSGLGTLGYLSAGTAGDVTSGQLISTVGGLGNIYLSTGGGGEVTKANLTSTTQGLGTLSYLSSSQLISTVAGLGNIYLSTGGGTGDVTRANLTSTTQGLGTLSYLSSPQLLSTVIGLSNVAVTRILAGTNITISPTSGLGAVTINATGGGGGTGSPVYDSEIASTFEKSGYFSSIQFGYFAASSFQGLYAVAIGINAGAENQGASGISIGAAAGISTQGAEAIAIGSSAGNLSQGTNSIAIGSLAGLENQSYNALAMGYYAAIRNQGPQTIAIGFEAGKYDQGERALSFGTNAGTFSQNEYGIAIGFAAGNTNQSTFGIAIGSEAGSLRQAISSIAIGTRAGYEYQSTGAIAIGANAGSEIQGRSAIAIGNQAGVSSQTEYAIGLGYQAGTILQGSNGIAIGKNAGARRQGEDGIAIGTGAGISSQQLSAVAIGPSAGGFGQGDRGIGIGSSAGLLLQGSSGVAIGFDAGYNRQGTYSVGIGHQAGNEFQGSNSIAMGYQAAKSTQGIYAIAIGANAGTNNQKQNSIAIGGSAGSQDQQINAVALGYLAGNTNQGIQTVAIGAQSGQLNQSTGSIAIGQSAGQNSQGIYSVSLGYGAGLQNQGKNSIAIGQAGSYDQGDNSIAIGNGAGLNNLPTSTIVLSALASTLNAPRQGFYVAPVTYIEGSQTYGLGYDSNLCEIGLIDSLSRFDMASTVAGLATSGYISSSQLLSTVLGVTQIFSTVYNISSAGGVNISATTSGFFLDLTNANISTLINNNITINTSGGNVNDVDLTSSIRGLATFGYLSSASNLVSTPFFAVSLQSTTNGLATLRYISSLSLTSTTNGLATLGYISSSQLASTLTSTLTGLSNVAVTQILAGTNVTISPTNGFGIVTINASGGGGGGSGDVTSTNLTSTTLGLGTLGYISTASLVSTVQGLGRIGYVSSTALPSTVLGLSRFYVSTAGLASNLSSFSTSMASNFFTRTLTASTITADLLNVSTISFGTGAGFITFPFLRANYISSFSSQTDYGIVSKNLSGAQLQFSSLQGDGSLLTNISSGLYSTIVGLSNIAVTKIIAGTNITISPVGGQGIVTINASASGGGGSGDVTSTNLTSTTLGLGTLGYLSTGPMVILKGLATETILTSTLTLLNYRGFPDPMPLTEGAFTLFVSSANLYIGDSGQIGLDGLPSQSNQIITDTLFQSTTSQMQSNIEAWSQYKAINDIVLSGGTSLRSDNGINTLQIKAGDLNITDVNGGPGTLTMGNFMFFKTSSSQESYNLAFDPLGTGTISSFLIVRSEGILAETASLYISSLYLGNLGGTVAGQLTTDDAATDLFWNGSKLNNQGGGGGVTSENVTSTTLGLGTLGYLSSTEYLVNVSTLRLQTSTLTMANSILSMSTNITTGQNNLFVNNLAVGSYNPARVVVSTLGNSGGCNADPVNLEAQDIGKYFIFTTNSVGVASVNFPTLPNANLDGWNVNIKITSNSMSDLSLQPGSETLTPDSATTILMDGTSYYTF
jgi:hypothetical protein